MVALSASPTASRPSSLKPRVETHPPYRVTLGPEAGDLLRAAGVEPYPWQQDALDLLCSVGDDGKWACFEYCEWVARQNGKGVVLEGRALAGLLLFDEALILWSAHEYKTAMEAMRRIVALLRKLCHQMSDILFDYNGVLIKVINSHGEESIERLDTGARIKFVARSKGSGRGFSGDVVIIDEAFAYTNIQQEALMPTMSARENPQIIYTSTPPLTGTSGEVMYALRHRGDPTAPRAKDDGPWEQDEALGYRDWGLGGELEDLDKPDAADRPDLDDRENWRNTNPSVDVGGLTEKFIARERRAMSDAGFGRERIGIWPRDANIRADGWQVISKTQWTAREDPLMKFVGRVALGVDVTPDRGWSAISSAGQRAAGGRGIDIIEHKPGTGYLIARLKKLVEEHDVCVIVVSDRAIADAAEEAKLPVYRASAGDMTSAANALYAGVADKVPEARDVWHHIHADLDDAVAGATKREVGDGWAWDRRSPQVNICPLVAGSLGLWGLSTPRIHVASLKPFALT